MDATIGQALDHMLGVRRCTDALPREAQVLAQVRCGDVRGF
jgi:hypothetical protein